MDHPSHHAVTERDGVVATLVEEPSDAEQAIALLDACEEVASAPLVDESERQRLRDLASADESAAHWHAVLAVHDGEAAGYGGVTVPGHGSRGTAVGDVAVARDHVPADVVLAAVVEALAGLGRGHAADRLELWLRAATADLVAVLTASGFEIARRLAVLGRPLVDLEPAGLPSGVSLRSVRDGDADDVVGVLAAAYAGTAEGGWDRERFDAKRNLPWFDPADLLVAVDDGSGELVGLHWTKRRDDVTGEVYNLAVHPAAQERGLGGALLRAGLQHLADRGCARVILWVDLANRRGVDLYERHGFGLRWEDVAFSGSIA